MSSLREAGAGVTTLVVSDLHLGAQTRTDVAAPARAARAAARRARRRATHLVLLGDVLELRDGPRDSALEAARGFFEDLGGARSASAA